MISLSPLSSTPPKLLQQIPVQTSRPREGTFILMLLSSPGIGSMGRDCCSGCSPGRFRYAYRSPLKLLTSHPQLALPLYKRYPRSANAPQSLLVVEFQPYMTYGLACSLTVLVHYRSVIWHRGISNVVVRSSHEPSLVHGTTCTGATGRVRASHPLWIG